MNPARNEAGGYSFLPSIRAFSSGAIAHEGFEIVRAVLREPVPVDSLPRLAGSVIAAEHGRPLQALCSVELRSPEPMSWQEFDDFNEGYAAMLDELGITLDGVNPVARTNVVPVVGPPATPVVHAFAFTVPAAAAARRTYVVAGAAEAYGSSADEILRKGEWSEDALREKAGLVIQTLRDRLAALGGEPDPLTVVHVYTPHPVSPGLLGEIAGRTGDGEDAVRVYQTRPPIHDLEFEMDMRSVARQVIA